MYISAASTISHHPTFRNRGFSAQLRELDPASELIRPDYSDYIPAMERRRMSDVQKMSIACSLDCMQQAGIGQPDAIIVGTSMGCCVNIRSFLDRILTANGGPLSPTSFIVSTHNTVAGQIALLLKNHGYNMTHTQNSLSFEQALMDAMLGIKEGFQHVLVGGADEEEQSLYNMRAKLNNEQLHLVSGASFFILSGDHGGSEGVNLLDVGSYGLIDSITDCTEHFLLSGGQSAKDIGLVLYAVNDKKGMAELNSIFRREQLFDYQIVAGTSFTNSAFAMHYGIDMLLDGSNPCLREHKKILICNNVIPENLGLILLAA
jgi:hypothetical protein